MELDHQRIPTPELLWVGATGTMPVNLHGLESDPTPMVVFTVAVYGTAFVALLVWAYRRAGRFDATAVRRAAAGVIMTGCGLTALLWKHGVVGYVILLAAIAYYVGYTRVPSGRSSPSEVRSASPS